MITWTALLAILRPLIRESTTAFSDADVMAAANAAILSVHGELFSPLAPTAITVTTGTIEYNVPTSFVYIDEVWTSTGIRMPDIAWELKAGITPRIVFREPHYTPTTGANPIVCGRGIQAVVSTGTDEINIDPGYIVYQTLANVHSALGGTASDTAAWHQAESTRLADKAEKRLADEFVLAEFQPKRESRLVPGAASGAGVAYTYGILTDPGNAGAIPVTHSGNLPIVTTAPAGETRTLAAPSFIGQELTLYMKTDGGDCVVTCATGMNVAGDTHMTFNAAGESIYLRGVEVGANLRWRCSVADGTSVAA
jgi:hypothetical protein